MKLIINTASTYKGGSVQVANSFLEECKKFKEHEYHVILGKRLSRLVKKTHYPKNFSFYNISYRPATRVFSLKPRVAFFKKLEKNIKPDIVFTTTGPAYWKPKAPHLIGYNLAHYIYEDSPFYSQISFSKRLKWKLKGYLLKFFLRGEADAYLVQTDDIKQRLQQWIPSKRVYTVSNTCSHHYYNLEKVGNKLPKRKKDEFRLLTLSAWYTHKNIDIITKVIDKLPGRLKQRIRFVLTLPQKDFENHFSEKNRRYIINVGPVDPSEGPALYSECDAMFLPTLLECFSASYPEAMKMKKPIITSNLGFARTICGDAALYADPINPAEISEKIVKLVDNPNLQKHLTEKGMKQLATFSTAYERAEKYIAILKEMRKPNIRQGRQVVIVNQASNYLTVGLCNAFKEKFDTVDLITGSIHVQGEGLGESINIKWINKWAEKPASKKLFSYIKACLKIYWLLLTRYKNYEVFFISLPPMAYLLSLILPQRCSMLIWDVYPDIFKITGLKESNLLYRIWASLNKIVFKKAFRLFTVGNRMADLLENYVVRDKITITPLWSIFQSNNKVEKRHNPFVKEQNIGDKFIIQYSGNIGLTHNVEVMIELAELMKGHANILFQIIGRGPRAPYLKELVKERELPNCQFLPFQSDEMFPYSLSAADIGVVILNEAASQGSVPSKLYNLMIYGIPSLYIASKDSELHDYADKYEHAKCIDQDNLARAKEFILKLKDSKEQYEQCSQNAVEASKHYRRSNADKIVEYYLQDPRPSRTDLEGVKRKLIVENTK